ncbi:hypothetical protein IPF86_00145 [Candidatus Nomurabacteria bacterium]|nr:MAG: hypothetical protein IPF86_00145 [Candidatus Nomurabacteria bacterium]
MTEQANTELEKAKLTKHDFYFETPIYELFEYSDLEKPLELFSEDVDAYSAKNHTDTTYSVGFSWIKKLDTEYVNQYTPEKVSGFAVVTLKCKRKDNDTLCFFVYKNEMTKQVMKVGQFPSLADLQFAELGKKYDKVLPEEDLKNLKKAIGLAAHGAGAGSFVYLRRIFENLIQETFSGAKDLKVAADVFKTTRMEDKIVLLKEHLPSQLVEMKAIYGILSRGVHELSEDECRQYFLPLKLSIELILDQKIDEKKKKDKDAEVKKQLQSISQQLGAIKKLDEK